MAILLIIALVLGGGTSVAAERALPGDALYSVKVNINEKIAGVVHFSDEAQAHWDTRLAERRLEEAEQLAVEGKLNAETRAQIEARLQNYVNAFHERANKIEGQKNSGESLEVRSDFEASLRAHGQVLAQIASEKSEEKDEIEPLLKDVSVTVHEATEERGAVEIKVAAEGHAEFKNAAEGKLHAAENKIKEVREYLTRIKSSVSANASAAAETKLNLAVNIVTRGKSEMEAGTYAKAFVSFQEALRVAQEAKLLVEGEDRHHLEVKVPALEMNFEDEHEMNGETHMEQESSSSASVKAHSETKMEAGSSSTKVQSEGNIKIHIGL